MERDAFSWEWSMHALQYHSEIFLSRWGVKKRTIGKIVLYLFILLAQGAAPGTLVSQKGLENTNEIIVSARN